MKFFKYGHVIYHWNRNFKLINKDITTRGQKRAGKVL